MAKGIILGFSIAAPVGPIGVLCIRRTLADGRLHGLVSGLGAATADAFYGAIAAFGLTFISNLLIDANILLRLVGGLFLLYLGISTFRAKPASEAAKASSKANGLLGAYLSTLVLTLTNPATILSFTLIFVGMNISASTEGYGAAGVLVLGVFIGSAMWWFILSGGVSLLRGRFDENVMLWVNRASGIIIIVFGILALVSLF